MKFTLDILAKDVAEKALDGFIYEGKTLREWVEIIVKQQPCEDCISRAQALHACCDEWNKDYKAIMKSIRQLPSVTPQQTRWIPVSERLPEEDGIYLATCDGEICGEDEPFSGLAEFENGKWIDDEEGYQCVLAWQPLPQPYKEKKE